MRECQVHPAVFIKIKRHHTHRRRQLFFIEIAAAQRCEFSFARIEIDRSSHLPARDDEVNCPVVVKIRADNSSARGRNSKRRFRGHIRECAIAIVAPENIVRRRARRSRFRRRCDVQIEVAIMVVIHKRQAHAAFFSADSHRLGHVLELAFTFVMEKLHPIAQANCQIGLAVIVEIAGRTSEAAPSEMDTCFLGHIVESSIAHAAQQPARAVRRTAYEEKIGLAILRTAWFNLDLLWAAALIGAGILTLIL